MNMLKEASSCPRILCPCNWHSKKLIETYQHNASNGIVIKRVLTDNRFGYKSKMFSEACQTLNVKQIFTKPYTRQINGKAERFIQTLLREWSYARTFTSSDQRNMVLDTFLHMYNQQSVLVH